MRRSLELVMALLMVATPVLAWGGHGHRTITYLALNGLPPEAPDWLRDLQTWHRIAYQANEPDRWRGWDALPLGHMNKPNHFLDIEHLDQFGLTLESLPKLRGDYLKAMAIAKHAHPEKVEPYDASKDRDSTKEWPGAAVYSITEQYAALQASFNTIRILERINDPARDFQMKQAKANAIYHMGFLSHFVGDTAQPLHTTKHFNGWVGDNPNGYTTDKGFHAFIDSKVLEVHGLGYETLREQVRYDRTVNALDPWKDVVEHLDRSLAQVEPLYRLEKEGTLRSAPGRELIAERLCEGAAMLNALYWAAWRSAEPTPRQLAQFQFYNQLPETITPSAPASAPAPSQETP